MHIKRKKKKKKKRRKAWDTQTPERGENESIQPNPTGRDHPYFLNQAPSRLLKPRGEPGTQAGTALGREAKRSPGPSPGPPLHSARPRPGCGAARSDARSRQRRRCGAPACAAWCRGLMEQHRRTWIRDICIPSRTHSPERCRRAHACEMRALARV
ncbi:uncharacterized protein GJ701_013454 isoform 1-T2 [Geothlypis trichas]